MLDIDWGAVFIPTTSLAEIALRSLAVELRRQLGHGRGIVARQQRAQTLDQRAHGLVARGGLCGVARGGARVSDHLVIGGDSRD